jgi:hypothetical protein
MLPNLPTSSGKRFEEERSSKVASCSGDQLREIQAVINCHIDSLPTLSTESAAPEKMIPGFYRTGIA